MGRTLNKRLIEIQKSVGHPVQGYSHMRANIPVGMDAIVSADSKQLSSLNKHLHALLLL
jgi:hypothetical protein